MSQLQIAIDGPAGSGKSTVAKAVAQLLNITYLDTGAMYRAVTYAALKANLSLHDVTALKALVDDLHLDISPKAILLNGEDVSDAIRTPEVTRSVSDVSKVGYVREKMVILQREIGLNQPVIMDGRDIGTVVLPNATYKFFLVADPIERAKRRMLELEAKGFEGSLDVIMEEIIVRDKIDSEREISPLTPAMDAIEIDTTHLSIDEVIHKIISIIKVEN